VAVVFDGVVTERVPVTPFFVMLPTLPSGSQVMACWALPFVRVVMFPAAS
jgi:hypothetical protein